MRQEGARIFGEHMFDRSVAYLYLCSQRRAVNTLQRSLLHGIAPPTHKTANACAHRSPTLSSLACTRHARADGLGWLVAKALEARGMRYLGA